MSTTREEGATRRGGRGEWLTVGAVSLAIAIVVPPVVHPLIAGFAPGILVLVVSMIGGLLAVACGVQAVRLGARWPGAALVAATLLAAAVGVATTFVVAL